MAVWSGAFHELTNVLCARVCVVCTAKALTTLIEQIVRPCGYSSVSQRALVARGLESQLFDNRVSLVSG